MRARTVALDCGPGRCVVGAFRPTADDELMLEAFSLLPCCAVEEEPVWPDLPASFRSARCLAVSLPANLGLSKMVRVPAMARRRRRQVVGFEAAQAIPRPLQEVVWDWVEVSPKGDVVDLAAMRLDLAERWCGAAEAAGTAVAAIVPRATALRLAVQHNYPELRETFVVAEVDAGSALLVRVGGGTMAVRLVGLPEPVSVPAGTAEPDGGPTVRLRRLTAEVQRLAVPDPAEASVAPGMVLFVCGPGAPECGEVAAALDDETLRVERLDAFRRVRLGRAAVGAGPLAPQFAVAVGVALGAVPGRGPNLLPYERRRERAFCQRRGWWLGSFGVLALLLGGLTLLFGHNVAGARARAAALEAGLAPWREAGREAQALQGELDGCAREIEVVEALDRARVSWAKWFAQLEEDCARAGCLWIETLQAERPTTGAEPVQMFGHVEADGSGAAAAGWRIMVSGGAIDSASEGRRGLEQVRTLLACWRARPGVVSVAGERFDTREAGVLRFSCILEVGPEVVP